MIFIFRPPPLPLTLRFPIPLVNLFVDAKVSSSSAYSCGSRFMRRRFGIADSDVRTQRMWPSVVGVGSRSIPKRSARRCSQHRWKDVCRPNPASLLGRESPTITLLNGPPTSMYGTSSARMNSINVCSNRSNAKRSRLSRMADKSAESNSPIPSLLVKHVLFPLCLGISLCSFVSPSPASGFEWSIKVVDGTKDDDDSLVDSRSAFDASLCNVTPSCGPPSPGTIPSTGSPTVACTSSPIFGVPSETFSTGSSLAAVAETCEAIPPLPLWISGTDEVPTFPYHPKRCQ